MNTLAILNDVLVKNGLLTAFAVVGATMWLSYFLSAKLTHGHLHGSALAIMLGLLLAYIGGVASGGTKGIVDIKLFAGMGLMGGAMLIAAGLVKSVLVMVLTPFTAKYIGLDNPRTAMIFGGMMGTTSGVCGGLAALDPKLMPYGAMTSTFYTGLGCLLGPSLLFFATRALLA